MPGRASSPFAPGPGKLPYLLHMWVRMYAPLPVTLTHSCLFAAAHQGVGLDV